MLLDDVVAAGPEEVVPVEDLVLEVGLALLASVEPDVPLVPVAAPGDDVADRSVVQALDGLDVRRLVAALGAGRDAQALLLGVLVGLQHLADAGAVDADGLFGEEVLAGGHGCLDVQRAEAGRRRQDDVVDVGIVDDLFVGVQADVTAIFGQIDAVAPLLHVVTLGEVGQMTPAILEPVLEDVAERDDRHAPGGVEDVVGGAGAAAAAADQADLDRVGTGGMNVGCQCQGPGGRGGGLQEFATGGHGGILRLLEHYPTA